MILDATTKTVEVVLGEVITTSNCDITAAFGDYATAQFLPGGSDTISNGTTPVTVVAAPSAGIQRLVNEVTVHNNDTVPHTIILRLNDNGTIRIVRDQTVASGGDFIYSPVVTPGSVAGTVPAPTVGTALDLIRINAAGSAYEAQTPNQVLNDIGAGSYSDIGRNLLHNGLFRVQQRGTGAFTANGAYSADRWLQALSTSTISTTIVALADADRTAIGDENAEFTLQSVVGGTAGAGDFAIADIQRIEAVQRLSGKTVLVSFWAKANTGTPKVGVEMSQSFGTGGSPSSAVTGIGSQAITLSTTWTRYTTTAIAVPSASGKTFGTTVNTDYTQLSFWQSSGSTNNSRAGGIGVQSYTFSIWGVQLEVVPSVATIATPLEKPDPRYEFANCQRFYQVGGGTFGSTGTTAATLFGFVSLPVVMRATPTVVGTNSGSSNVTSPNVVQSGVNGPGAVVATGTCTASGAYLLSATFTASADL